MTIHRLTLSNLIHMLATASHHPWSEIALDPLAHDKAGRFSSQVYEIFKMLKPENNTFVGFCIAG